MPLFAAIGLDHPPHSMEKRLAFRTEHRAYVVGNDRDIVLASPLLDGEGNQNGSFYLFEAESEQQVRDWLADEPFFQADVYQDVIIRRFVPGKNSLPLQDWPMGKSAASSVE